MLTCAIVIEANTPGAPLSSNGDVHQGPVSLKLTIVGESGIGANAT